MIYFNRAGRDSQNIIQGYQSAFVTRTLTPLALGALPALLLLSSLVPAVRSWFGSSQSRLNQPGWPWSVALALGIVFIGLSIWQILRLLNPGDPSGYLSAFNMGLPALALVSVAMMGLAVWGFVRSGWGIAARVYFILIAAGFVGLTVWVNHWNLMGMMG